MNWREVLAEEIRRQERSWDRADQAWRQYSRLPKTPAETAKWDAFAASAPAPNTFSNSLWLILPSPSASILAKSCWACDVRELCSWVSSKADIEPGDMADPLASGGGADGATLASPVGLFG